MVNYMNEIQQDCSEAVQDIFAENDDLPDWVIRSCIKASQENVNDKPWNKVMVMDPPTLIWENSNGEAISGFQSGVQTNHNGSNSCKHNDSIITFRQSQRTTNESGINSHVQGQAELDFYQLAVRNSEDQPMYDFELMPAFMKANKGLVIVTHD